jgi:hypothetical protein
MCSFSRPAIKERERRRKTRLAPDLDGGGVLKLLFFLEEAHYGTCDGHCCLALAPYGRMVALLSHKMVDDIPPIRRPTLRIFIQSILAPFGHL